MKWAHPDAHGLEHQLEEELHELSNVWELNDFWKRYPHSVFSDHTEHEMHPDLAEAIVTEILKYVTQDKRLIFDRTKTPDELVQVIL